MENQAKVFIYTLSTCIHCRRTKKLLNDLNIDFDFVDVDLLEGEERARVVAEMKKYNPLSSFPTICIGDDVVVGYRPVLIKKRLGLD